MSQENYIPKQIPKPILDKKNFDDIILYTLGFFGSCEREIFINDSEKGINNRMNKNTFHKWAKELKSKGYIEVNKENKNSIYNITQLGLDELLRRLKNYQLDFETVNSIEQKRIKNYLEKIKSFFEKYKINDDDIKVDFLELANEITSDKINIFSEEKISKLILFLVFNHPKYYLLYDISIKDYLTEINKKTDESLTENDLNMFLQLVIEEDIYDLRFFVINLDESNKKLYFKANSQYGIIFETIIKKKLRYMNYLKNLKQIEIDLRILINEIVDLLIDKFNLFDILLRENLIDAVNGYILNFKEIIKSKSRYSLVEYSQYFSIFEIIKHPISKVLNLPHAFENGIRKSRLDKYREIYITEEPWFPLVKVSELRDQYIEKYKEEDLKEFYVLLSDFEEREDFFNLLINLKNLIQIKKEPILVYWLIELYIISNFYNEALETLQEYSERKIIPIDYRYYYLKSWIYYSLEKYNKALKNIELAIELSNDKIRLKFVKFSIYKKSENFDKALTTIDEILKDNSSIAYYIEKVLVLTNLKKYGQANLEFNKITKLESKNLLLNIIKIEEILKNIQNEKEIILEYENLTKKVPNNYLVNYFMSSYLQSIMNYDYALLIINKALELDPKSIEASHLKIEILNSLEKFDDLINFVKSGKPFVVLDHASELLIKSGKFEEALSLTDYILGKTDKPEDFQKKIPDSRDKNRLMEFYLSLSGEEKKAFVNYLNYIQLKLRKSFILSFIGTEEEDISILKSLLEDLENTPYYEFYKMHYLFLAKKYKDLIDYAENISSKDIRITDINPILNSFAYSLKNKNKTNLAIKLIQIAIKIDSKDGNLYDSYGDMLISLKNYKEALEKFKKAIDTEPDGDFTHESFIKMGICHLKMKKYIVALKFLGKGKDIAIKRDKENWVRKACFFINQVKKSIKRNELLNMN